MVSQNARHAFSTVINIYYFVLTVNALYNSFKWKKKIKNFNYEMFMKGGSYNRKKRRIA